MDKEDRSQDASSAGGDGSASPDPKPGESTGNGNNDKKTESGGNPKTVSWDSYAKTRDDMHRFKKQAGEMEARLADLETQSLKDKENYKELYQKSEEKRKAAEDEVKKVKGWAVSTQRYTAVKSEAEKAGIIPAALKDLERLSLEEVEVEVTSNGRFIVTGADSFVDGLKTDSPHWFQSATPPKINGGGGGTPSSSTKGELTAHDVVKAERLWKTGKGTREDYERAVKKFSEQRRQKK